MSEDEPETDLPEDDEGMYERLVSHDSAEDFVPSVDFVNRLAERHRLMMNGMSGGSGLVSKSFAGISASAGAGAITGEATRYGVETGLKKAGANKDTQESVSNLAGGLVGGATTAVAGDLATIGTATLMGAEVGELGGPLGVAVGAGVGALFGLSAYGLSKLNHVSGVQKAETAVANSFVGGTKETYRQVKNLGKAIGKWFR